ncbi:MAG: hypothetical protein CVT75_08670 [Alphaproteobacteria bacterium HGW-Alphaproteobacteria-14]|nr:MAG: hypothetical protein CVT75_08670 [Alphaproteobacteria bacterium HGW-Alphaproteobacteria-14]
MLLAANAPPRLPPPFQPAESASRPQPRPTPPASAPERVAIDLGGEEPSAALPEQIDILVPPPAPEAANAALIKECEDQQEAGVVAGEIVVCRALVVDTSQLYSGSREAWLKNYAERTQNVGTIAPPDVAGAGIFRGPATISGLCFIGPCPDKPALMIDIEAIPLPPAGSDAERVGQGLSPVETDNAPLSDDSRQRLEAELGLPAVEEAAPKK